MITMSDGDAFVVDHRSNYGHFLDVFSLGRDAQGNRISLDRFNDLSRKPLSKLYEEIQEREVLLRLNQHTRRIERHAHVIKIIIKNPDLKILWLEEERHYPNGKVLKSQLPDLPPDYTNRETLIRGKEPLWMAEACIEQEAGDFFKRVGRLPTAEEYHLMPQGLFGHHAVEHSHESTAYHGVITIGTATHYELRLPWLGHHQVIEMRDYNGKEKTPKNDNWVKIVAIEHSYAA